ncbi:uncharacterized protein ALTATR162_LOCUS1052 [Alternaria atra]|uniref:J domain-containing protein n=1 Tax=Alternaria atra TaxID=119953 RepID=A0A8J2HX16_9PLEO|nr:uncharacterized protein ALTATR162_LOCUS1052 [Alternaria atra]CAG5141976.1 unnamed protein product [Alternaria atra]
MAGFFDKYFFAIAATTPLPPIEDGEATENDRLATPRPRTRTRTQAPASLQPFTIRPTVLPSPVVKEPSKKRKPDFSIFLDTDAANDTLRSISTPKRSRISTPRTPLSDMTFSTASTPAPSPRLPDTPFPFSTADPRWENTENYNPYTMTPPATPLGPRPTPTTPAGPPSPLSARALRLRRARASSSANLLPPVNMLAYNMLGLQTWRVSSVGINLAYRKTAAISHPDKAAPREKELATLEMQQINAVKEMLLDKESRTKYHRDGVIPWVI